MIVFNQVPQVVKSGVMSDAMSPYLDIHLLLLVEFGDFLFLYQVRLWLFLYKYAEIVSHTYLEVLYNG